MKFFITVLCLNLANLALCQKSSSNESFVIDGPIDNCIELNQQRLDMQDCCDYPRIHFFNIYTEHCVDECIGSKDMCCAFICIWRNTKITFTETGVNLQGLKETLLESVVHKDEWENLIHKAVDQCDAETVQQDMDKTCNVPNHLSSLVNCAIKKLFLMCPSMHKSAKCETTRKYVDECL